MFIFKNFIRCFILFKLEYFCYNDYEKINCILIVNLFFFFQFIYNKVNINVINEYGNILLYYVCFWGYDYVVEVSMYQSYKRMFNLFFED